MRTTLEVPANVMEFDLFLSFSSADRAAARELCRQLRAHGIRVWFDEDQLLPGRSVQRRMKQGLASSTAGAVLLGADGLGPWQDEEMQVLLSQAVRHGKAVIPVLLPKAPAEPQDPFLASRRWVDLRSGLGGAAFEQLLRGIRAAVSEQGGDLSPNDGTALGGAGAPPLPVLRIFLATPGDVQDERKRALEAIEALTLEPELRGRVRVEPVAWDKPGSGAPMLATMTPREAIAADLPKPSECDVLLVVFGARMGTPLDPDWQTKPDGSPYRSGTEWQFLDGLRAAEVKGTPEILVYRRAKAPSPALDDPDFDEILGQWREVEAFFAEYFHSDVKAQRDYSTYDSPSDLQERLTADLIKLASKRVVEPSAEVLAEAPRWPGSPYPGLRALRDGDAPVFFGRRRDADALIDRLKDPGCRFLAVVGPSGSGKSSLVWAGVLPRLKDSAVSGSGSWSWLRFTPAQLADDPFLSLAAQLAEHFPGCRWEPRDLVPGLCKGEELGVILDKALTQVPDGAELLLFADQLEELFGRVAERDRGAFVDLLARASVHPRVRILATLRADFIPDCLKYPPLAELLNAGQRLLAAPGQSARERMVTEPARRAGLDLEPELAWRIVSNTGDEPGALPLMAYALERLYECDGETGCLTHASYDAFGGVRGAIADQAQQVFAGFAGERTEAVADAALKVLFVELVDVEDERAPATRRRAPLSRLAALPEVAELVRRLTDARLLVTDRPAGRGSEPVVDVAHEALLHGWDRLADWIARRRDDLRLRDRLRRDTEEWERDGFRTKHLPGRERAEDMKQALEGLHMAPTPTEAAFLDQQVRAGWLLERDLAAWEAAGRDPTALWARDRFKGFADLAPGKLAPPGSAQARFLLTSLVAGLESYAHDPATRRDMGDALGALGDPRFDVAHWQLPDDETLGFLEVGAGRFLMGTDPEKDPDGWDDEQPRHPVELDTFYIARFPVTVAQFAAFASDSGHDPADRDALRGNPSHPVTLATLYDAGKYCDWLQARLQGLAKGRVAEVPDGPAKRFWQGVAKGRVKAGLPSEAEWEKAARGADGRIYPWGRDIDPTLANYKETDLKAPCAVGCFPAGKSPCGCEDMSGNVWEWTRSLWGPDYVKAGFRYRYRMDDGREDLSAAGDVFRVLRGGSLASYSNFLRCPVRTRRSPNVRYDLIGFRVVWSPLL